MSNRAIPRLNWIIGDQRLSLTRDGHLVADLRLTPSQAEKLAAHLLDFAGERYSAVRSRGAKQAAVARAARKGAKA